jgi:hypothetical protein
MKRDVVLDPRLAWTSEFYLANVDISTGQVKASGIDTVRTGRIVIEHDPRFERLNAGRDSHSLHMSSFRTNANKAYSRRYFANIVKRRDKITLLCSASNNWTT